MMTNQLVGDFCRPFLGGFPLRTRFLASFVASSPLINLRRITVGAKSDWIAENEDNFLN